ncbi:MAG: T9SS type A sorting domain-containing protein [Bacteroidetes bacterium]|nr:T9SS type A sorting domain-containing protein [Bacteroidota bacterium]
MRKVLLVSAVFLGVGANAQTFTAADTLAPGMSTVYYVMDSSAATLDATTGTGVTWDYSAVYGELGVATNQDNITDASTAPFASTFTEAEYNDDLATFASIYFSNSPDSTTVHGYVFTVDAYEVVMHHDIDPLKALTYPISVGATYSDNTEGTVDVNSGTATGTTTGSANVTVDGFGTLKVGGDTYTNVIRVKLVENISTSITITPFPPDNGTVVRTIYSYYQLGTDKQAIFMHGTVTITSTLINDNFTSVYYAFTPDYAGVAELNDGDFSVYPNPANHVVNITTDGTADKLNVFNTSGQLVASVINPAATETIDVTNFVPGMYIIQVTNNGVVTEDKLVIE